VTGVHGNKFGPDMNWFFDQTLYGTGICDYKVARIFNNEFETQKDTSISEDTLRKKSDNFDKNYKSGVELERAGEVMLPVDILIHFNNGDEVRESWDGKSRFKDFFYSGARTIEWVKIDPEFKIRMDINYINNSLTLKPDPVPVRRLANKLIVFLQFFINFISL
jgi:hypothetical protein